MRFVRTLLSGVSNSLFVRTENNINSSIIQQTQILLSRMNDILHTLYIF